MKRCYYLLLLSWLPLPTAAQSFEHTLDSLRNELARARTDTDRVKATYQLGRFYAYQNLDSARWYAEQGLGQARKIHFAQGELANRDLLAESFSERDIPRSVKLYLENLHLAQEANNRYWMRKTYMELGTLQVYLANDRQAISYYKMAQTLALQDNDKATLAFAYHEQGSSFWSLQQLDSCRYYFRLAERASPTLWENPFYLYYWGTLEATQNPGKANAYFQKSVQIFKAQQDLRGLSLVYRWYSEFFWKHNQPDSSIIMAKRGLLAAQALNNSRTMLNNSRLLAKYYQALGRPDSAYKYQSIMLVARDSLFSQQKINQLQTTLIEEQQRNQQLEEEKSQFESQVKIYGLLGVVSILVLLAGLLYRTNQQKQRTNGQLRTLNLAIEQQKEEIETQRDHLEDTLTELQATQTQLIQKEKLASLGELTAGIAHEIQNPLNFVNNFSEVSAELIEEQKEALSNGDVEEAGFIANDLGNNLRKIHHHGGRAAAIVRGMLEHSRTDTGERRPTDLNALAGEYLNIAYHGLRAKDKNFNSAMVTDFSPDLGRVTVVPQEIGRVLLNLYNNAFYAVAERAKQNGDPDYKPTVEVQTQRQADQVIIRVRDNGMGIPESVRAKIFQPFFTTKPTGEGTGLGLSLSYDIVTKGHGGTLAVENTEGEGTLFCIMLPV